MSFRSHIFLIGSLIACALFAPAALAQDTPPVDGAASEVAESSASSDPVVHAMLVEAVAEYDAGRYAEAQAIFRRASERAPSARTLRGLGMASYELREYVVAARALEQALAETYRPLTDAQRAHVEDLLGRARGFVATLHLHIAPALASLRVDGALAEPAADGTLLLDPGRHTLALDHEGYDARTLELQLASGVDQELSVTLERTPVPIPPPVPTDTTGLAWAGAGFGIAALIAVGTSLGTGIGALVARDQLRSGCSVYVCPDSLRGTRDSAEANAFATDVAGTIAAVLGAASVSMLLVAAVLGGSTPAVEAAAACTTDGCAFTVRGTL